MKNSWKICVLTCVFVTFVFVWVGLSWRDVKQVSECIVARPLEGVSGFITYPGMYSVSYRGTTKKDRRDLCEVRMGYRVRV